MATPRRTRPRGGPVTPSSTRSRRNQPPQADLPPIDTAFNLLYGSSGTALPNDSETGARLTQSSIAKNMAGLRPPRSQSALSERSTREERAMRRELVRGSVTSKGSKNHKGPKQTEPLPLLDHSNVAAPTTGGGSAPPLVSGPLIGGDLPIPDSGGTTSKTWGQETDFNGHAGIGVGQNIPPESIGSARDVGRPSGQIVTTAKGGKEALSPFPDNFSDDRGLLDSEDPESSSDSSVLPRHERFDRESSTPSFAVWAFRHFAQLVLTSSLLLLILWGVGRTGLLQGYNLSGLPGFSVSTPADYLASSSAYEIIRAINSAISGQSDKLSNELHNLGGNIKGINETVELELKKIYAILGKLTQNYMMHDESIKTLRSIIPELTWVSRSPTGDIEIQQDFWLALRSKIEHEFGKSKSGSKDTDLWDRFLELNEARMRPYIAEAVEGHIRKAGSEGVLVTREHFLAIIQANYEKHSQDMRKLTDVFEEKYRTMDQRLDNVNRDMDRKIAMTAIQKVEALSDRISRTLPAAQLEALVQANIDRNSQQALTSINYFSPGMGAIADPRHSSNAYDPPRSLMNRFLGVFFPIGSYISKDPEVSLYGWEEPLDCWCSSNVSNKETLGHAQIAVATAMHVYPKDVTVEHIPRTAVPSVRNAPKDMELWVSITERTLHDKLKEESEALLGLTPPRGSKLGRGWLRIATWRYTPYGVNHVLNFPVQVDLERLKIPGKYFLVRATTNWEADFTCFYRVRMGGKAADPSIWKL